MEDSKGPVEGTWVWSESDEDLGMLTTYHVELRSDSTFRMLTVCLDDMGDVSRTACEGEYRFEDEQTALANMAAHKAALVAEMEENGLANTLPSEEKLDLSSGRVVLCPRGDTIRPEGMRLSAEYAPLLNTMKRGDFPDQDWLNPTDSYSD
eukprot:TRINITY_DN2235_c0_g2_i1.p1 TRINITY_DN2235_c0_g2~~TRINITY_DN2235_c0_g2_i1.p1  ORF type:complete len:151 (+),score=43.94 TRINITY_DN2235_c0_g2_i1:46-498(+)